MRIAIADREPETCRYLQETLAGLGHFVAAAVCRGEELIERTTASRPDLVLLDVQLPDLQGPNLAEALCRAGSLPIIFLAPAEDSLLLERIPIERLTAYLIKPIRPGDLGPALALAVRRFEQLQGLRREVADLRQALQDRKTIERAKGLLMKRAGLGEEEAFRRLQKLARETNQKLVAVAQMILKAEEIFPAGKEGPAV